MAKQVSQRDAGAAAQTAVSTAVADRPNHLIIFKRPSEENEQVLRSRLGVEMATGVSARSSVSIMTPKHTGKAATRMYNRLGVGVADLDPEDREEMLHDDHVEDVVPNEIRSIPRPLSSTVDGTDHRMTQAIAYLRGVRDTADSAIQFLSSGQTGLPLGRQLEGPSTIARPPAPMTSAHSWCLDLIGIGPSYATATGRGVKVAILDTGIDLQHPDFAGAVIAGQNAVSFIEGEHVQDGNGHGTHCAGIAVGPAQSSGGRRYGVAPDAELLVGKVLNNAGSGYDDQIIDGIDWAESMGARIISMSLGSYRAQGAAYSGIYERVFANLQVASPGILVVAAAGNASERPFYTMPVENPAACPSAIAVAAIDRNRRIAPFSCRQMDSIAAVDLSAPGVDVYSSWTGGGFQEIDGTSMAAPHVAGIAALIAELNPTMSAAGIRNLLSSSAIRLGAAEDFGAGLVQAP